MNLCTVANFLYVCMVLITAYGLIKEKPIFVNVALGVLITLFITVSFVEHRAYSVRQQYLTDFCVKSGESVDHNVYNCDGAKITYEAYTQGHHIKFLIKD